MYRDSLLKELREYWEKNAVPNISDINLQLLQDLISIKKPHDVLEIWTANWFSSIWMWIIWEKYGTKITTIDFSPQSFWLAQENIAKAKLEGTINSIFWNALEVIPSLQNRYDFVFIDGMMRRTVDFLWLVWNKVEPGWIIIIDDVIKFRDKMIGLDDFLKKHKIRNNILPIDIDDGIMMIIKEDIQIEYNQLSH